MICLQGVANILLDKMSFLLYSRLHKKNPVTNSGKSTNYPQIGRFIGIRADYFLRTSLILLLSTVFMNSCCKEETCACKDYEDCIDGECRVKENYFRWGESGISGSDLYLGVASENSCIDTVLFNIEPDNRFNLFTIGSPFLVDAGVSINAKRSDTEFILGVGDVLCYNPRLYADIICELYVTDSVYLNFLFWDIESPGDYVDSTTVILYPL